MALAMAAALLLWAIGLGALSAAWLIAETDRSAMARA
jgi:streptomycin 6-kinase